VVSAPVSPGASAPVTPVVVARYSFDGGVVGGHVADISGRGPVLTVRSADRGTIRFVRGAHGGRYASFPDACATGRPCPRALLEAPDAPDLNPGIRLFRWSAAVHLTKAQLKGSPNVVQKGVATGSEWKLQIGATQARAQCMLVGADSPTAYVARSTTSVADGTWHKIGCERSGTALSISVDGKVLSRTTIPATLSITNTMPMRIGGANLNTAGVTYHGLLDDVYAELG
jgi:concanavalin A-like lectin/glucanase superfamily protein